ncbi:CBS domain-containing protein [Sphaerisporangium sp. NPDC051017]|uniref:CBS domain-containing protein n=1 Tax=Sphaerisporangium sp. NPDC051017 TaxID=3154636 RepID=UPI00343D982D
MTIEVGQVMGRVGIAVQQEAPFAEILATMRKYAVGAVAVIDRDRRPVGVVSEDDLLLKQTTPAHGNTVLVSHRRRIEQRKAGGIRAGELMTAPAITVTPGTPIRDAARLMHDHHVKQLPVIDPVTGRIAGTVHQSDLLRVFERPVEELRHEIATVVHDGFGVDPATLSIGIAGGVVTIRGAMEYPLDISSLLDAVREVDGVVAVVSHLTCPPWRGDVVLPPLL